MNKYRFQELCLRNSGGCSQTVSAGWFDEVRRHYQEPGRRYHTPEHVEHCLRQLDLVPGLIDDRDALEFAIWYHDVIYDIENSENELKSARLFQAHAGQ